MKPICRNCHFLSKEHCDNAGQVHTFSLSRQERDKALETPNEIVPSYYSLNCKMGVWDEGVSETAKDRNSRINIIKRDSSCFFFPHHPAMLFDAARELQKRESEYRELKQSNLYTRIGLWIAAGALFLDTFIEVLKYLCPKI